MQAGIEAGLGHVGHRRGNRLGLDRGGATVLAIREFFPSSAILLPSARLKSNVERFGRGVVQAIGGDAPETLSELPDPDAVFVGGSGGLLDAILEAVAKRLVPGGRVVLNCITLENFARGWEKLRELGLEPEATSVQLAHSRPLGRLHSLEPENPIFILRAVKR